MIQKIASIVIALLAAGALTLFGFALLSDYFVWHDRQIGQANVVSLREHKAKPLLLRNGKEKVKKIYRIEFLGKTKTFSMFRANDAKAGEKIQVIFSPHVPKNFKLIIPSIWWLGIWTALYAVALPLISIFFYLFIKQQWEDGKYAKKMES